jgi:hypothetical protein
MDTTIPFARVRPDEIDAFWDEVGTELEAVAPGPGYVGRVRAQIEDGSAHLFVVPDGFFIVTEEFDVDAQRKELFVIHAAASHHEDGFPKGGNVARYRALVERLAREVGAAAVRTRSPHRGMGRLLGPDWCEAFTEYVLEVG